MRRFQFLVCIICKIIVRKQSKTQTVRFLQIEVAWVKGLLGATIRWVTGGNRPLSLLYARDGGSSFLVW